MERLEAKKAKPGRKRPAADAGEAEGEAAPGASPSKRSKRGGGGGGGGEGTAAGDGPLDLASLQLPLLLTKGGHSRLMVHELGQLDTERPAYHLSDVAFPIGGEGEG
jgi:hypothetical protein